MGHRAFTTSSTRRASRPGASASRASCGARGSSPAHRAALSLDRHRAGRAPGRPDRLRRDFRAAAPNQRWVADITSVGTGQGWLHLAIVLDLYARRIVGWAMAPILDQALAAEALAMALADRRPAPGLLVHSDRGGPVPGDSRAAATRRPSGHRQHQPAGALPRQRRGRELLPHPQDGAGLPAPVSHPRGGPPGDLRVHRGLLQSHPSALDEQLPLTR
jgi:transposase InsO family protein